MEQEEPRFSIQKLLTAESIISLTVLLLTGAFGYGNLSNKVEGLRSEVAQLRQMTMTPGAAEAVAGIREKDRAQDEAIAELRAELRSQRVEWLTEIRSINAKLDDQRQGHKAN